MGSDPLHRRREHNLLLLSKLFDIRQRASPFTVIFDSLEQTGRPLVRAFIQRANVGSLCRISATMGVDNEIFE